jgi:hypothetical protein
MILKLFRKTPLDVRPRIELDSSLAEELARRVSAIEFQPSKGFLKDRRQTKRPAPSPAWTQNSSPRAAIALVEKQGHSR